MKFNCRKLTGETEALRRLERRQALQEWHKVFAWWPILVDDNDCRWLEWVERRYNTFDADEIVYGSVDLDSVTRPEYRAIPNKEK